MKKLGIVASVCLASTLGSGHASAQYRITLHNGAICVPNVVTIPPSVSYSGHAVIGDHYATVFCPLWFSEARWPWKIFAVDITAKDVDARLCTYRGHGFRGPYGWDRCGPSQRIDGADTAALLPPDPIEGVGPTGAYLSVWFTDPLGGYISQVRLISEE